MVQLKDRVIRFPEKECELKSVASGFKFPGAIGAVDGSHIYVKQCLEHLQDYTNRKMSTSIVLQAACDSKMLFIDVSAGWPGSMHDSRIFHKSNLCKRLANMQLGGYHLLGDSAYALATYMMVPFRDNGRLTNEQVRFNVQHSSSRTVIERAFARLKGKFRRLKFLDIMKLDLASDIIMTACILHNYILINDALDGDSDDDETDEIQQDIDDNLASVERLPRVGNAVMKRNTIMSCLQ